MLDWVARTAASSCTRRQSRSCRKGSNFGRVPPRSACLGKCMRRLDTAEAQKILEQLQELSKQRYVTPYVIARIHVTLGEKDKALQWLETAYQQQAEWMVLLKVDPCFDDLRPDPRFQSLMRRMNFPE